MALAGLEGSLGLLGSVLLASADLASADLAGSVGFEESFGLEGSVGLEGSFGLEGSLGLLGSAVLFPFVLFAGLLLLLAVPFAVFSAFFSLGFGSSVFM